MLTVICCIINHILWQLAVTWSKAQEKLSGNKVRQRLLFPAEKKILSALFYVFTRIISCKSRGYFFYSSMREICTTTCFVAKLLMGKVHFTSPSISFLLYLLV